MSIRQGGEIVDHSTTEVQADPQFQRERKRKRDVGHGVHQARTLPPDHRREVCDETQTTSSHPIGLHTMHALEGAVAPILAPLTGASHHFPIASVNGAELRRMIDISRLVNITQTTPLFLPSINPYIYVRPSVPVLALPLAQSHAFVGLRRGQLHESAHSFFPGESFGALIAPSLRAHAVSRGRGDVDLDVLAHEQRANHNFFPSPSISTSTTNRNNGEIHNTGRTAKNSSPASTTNSRPRKSKAKVVAKRFTGLCLYTPDDRGKLNENQILVRKQIEIFCATEDDILSITRGKNKPIVLHQVGLRCRHCSHVPVGRRRKGSTYFPSNLMGIYQAAQNLSVEHLQSLFCTELPSDIAEQFSKFAEGKSVASSAGKKYWAEAGSKLGLVDTEDGIRFAKDLR